MKPKGYRQLTKPEAWGGQDSTALLRHSIRRNIAQGLCVTKAEDQVTCEQEKNILPTYQAKAEGNTA